MKKEKKSFLQSLLCIPRKKSRRRHENSVFTLADEDFKFTEYSSDQLRAHFMALSQESVEDNAAPKNKWMTCQTEEQIRRRLESVLLPISVQQDPSGRTEQRTLTLNRLDGQGFGFTLVGSSPVRVGKVEQTSCAGQSGICSGDIIVSINNHNVLMSSCDSVVQAIRSCSGPLEVRIQRWLDSKSEEWGTTFSRKHKSSPPAPPPRTCFPSQPASPAFPPPPPLPATENPSCEESQFIYQNNSEVSYCRHTNTPNKQVNTDYLTYNVSQGYFSNQGKSDINISSCTQTDREMVNTLNDSLPMKTQGYIKQSGYRSNENIQSCVMSNCYVPTNIVPISGNSQKLSSKQNFSKENYLHHQNKSSYPNDVYIQDYGNMSAQISSDNEMPKLNAPNSGTYKKVKRNPSVKRSNNDCYNNTDLASSKQHQLEMSYNSGSRSNISVQKPITIDIQDLSHVERVRQNSVGQVLLREEIFYKAMIDCQEFYMKYLQPVLFNQDFNVLFFKIDQMAETSRLIITQVNNSKIPFKGQLLSSGDSIRLTGFVDNLGQVYRQRLFQMCDDFREFGEHLTEFVIPLLHRLTEDCGFQDVIRRLCNSAPDIPSLNACLLKPIYHVRVIAHEVKSVLAATSQSHQDFMFLDDVLQSLENCVGLLPQAEFLILPTVVLASSLVNSSSGVSSDHELETELSLLQNQLRFASSVNPFDLTAKMDRQLLFSGDLFYHRGSGAVHSVHGLLFSDMLLLTQKETDTTLTVIAEPYYLEDISAAEFEYPQAPLLFHLCFGVYRILRLEASNTAQKLQWKNFIAYALGIKPSYNTSSRPYMRQTGSLNRKVELPLYTDRIVIA